jgi:hypothetical protein
VETPWRAGDRQRVARHAAAGRGKSIRISPSRIASRGFLAKGLSALADSGVPKDAAIVEDWGDSDRLQRYAAAALGRPGACDAFAAEALQLCVEKYEK